MAVVGATDNAKMILEQIMMERLLDAVCPELRAGLKEQKPKTTEELGNLANLHVQSRKGPLVKGKCASITKSWGFNLQKQSYPKRDLSSQEHGQEQLIRERPKPVSIPVRRNTRPVTCYKCGKPGHMSYNCGKGNTRPAQGSLLCMTPLTSEHPEFPPCNVWGKIGGKSVEMVVDSG